MTSLINTILKADCVRAMRQLPAASVNFILTDPPYIVRYKDRSGRTIRNDDNAAWLKPAFAEMYRVLADNSCCVSFYGWTFADRFVTAYRNAGFRIVGHITFKKNYVSSTGYMHSQHECAYLLAKGSPQKPEVPIAMLCLGHIAATITTRQRKRLKRSSHSLRRSLSPAAWYLIRFAARPLRCLRRNRLAAAT